MNHFSPTESNKENLPLALTLANCTSRVACPLFISSAVIKHLLFIVSPLSSVSQVSPTKLGIIICSSRALTTFKLRFSSREVKIYFTTSLTAAKQHRRRKLYIHSHSYNLLCLCHNVRSQEWWDWGASAANTLNTQFMYRRVRLMNVFNIFT